MERMEPSKDPLPFTRRTTFTDDSAEPRPAAWSNERGTFDVGGASAGDTVLLDVTPAWWTLAHANDPTMRLRATHAIRRAFPVEHNTTFGSCVDLEVRLVDFGEKGPSKEAFDEIAARIMTDLDKIKPRAAA